MNEIRERILYSLAALKSLLKTLKCPVCEGKNENGALFYNSEGKTVILDYKERWVDSRPTFRQDRKLNTKELAFWNTIPEYYQAQVLAWAPPYEGNSKEHPYYKGRPYGWY